ncbi:MAG TPA: hemerythrin domain-containing protein [Candidatus Aminicenantes bacterium]|nr:hemerythrin domain-containing protein [Candidatus Aminicenantes bacterium]
MRPTAELSREHQAILKMIGILGAMAGRLEAGAAVAPDDLERAVDFIRVFADKCHHAKEEDLLFPAMEKAGIPRERGPIGVMLADHVAGRARVAAMAEAIPAIRAGVPEAAASFAAAARGYGELLTGHIFKEDRVLYPMADARLTAEQQKTLEAGFAEVERTIVGQGRHEEYHRLLERLEKSYLG